MNQSAHRAVAIVGLGAVMPDASNTQQFWQNIKDGRYSISEVTSDRWNAELYYDADPKAPDKTYTKIGGWVRDWEWDPLKWKLPIPPRVAAQMDLTQKWAIVAVRQALADCGHPERPLNPERTAVILGNAMGGDTHLMTSARILFPEYQDKLRKSPSFAELPEDLRKTILDEMRERVSDHFPEITEDTMPGELSNIIAGRIAALYNFRGPNYVTDAACASAMAAISAAIEGLEENHYDAVITGGVDANMSPQTFVKFCKIGALSATGTRPFAEGADGFVMGEGAALFVIKRLEDAERAGDKIYAVIRALGGSSDGRGKGITAPNPIGQKLAVQRAWETAGLTPSAGDMIEGHGTSTIVGDVAELESLTEAFADYDVPPGSVTLGSVKSNIGHLKGAAGAAGLLKATLSLHEKVLPPSLNFHKPNPNIDFETSPFTVNTELKPWDVGANQVRRAGVSAFGFGGTNFHAVLEEYIPGRLDKERKAAISASEKVTPAPVNGPPVKAPHRGAMVIGAETDDALRNRLAEVQKDAEAGQAPPPQPPLESDLRAPVRIAIDYGDAKELADKAARALKALEQDQTGRWKALRAKGIFLGRGEAPKVAFLFTGQGSQYVNMLRDLKEIEPIVADTFAEADVVMKPHLDKPLTDYIFVDESDQATVDAATEELKQTVITQPAVLATETALSRVLEAYGIVPDMVMGHSLGEYGALVASGGLPFDEGLYAVSARGGEMTRASKGDNGLMAAVHGPNEEIKKLIAGIDGYVVLANNNSTKESVIGGDTPAVEEAMVTLREAGFSVTQLPVSHAFHTKIVGAAADALVVILKKMKLQPPKIPVVANISGDYYPMHPNAVPEMVEILASQVASPVQFVKGLNTLYDSGARMFVELGPKRALYGFSSDVVGSREGVTTLFTNHPRVGGIASFNQALCGLYAAGLGVGLAEKVEDTVSTITEAVQAVVQQPSAPVAPVSSPAEPVAQPPAVSQAGPRSADQDRYVQLGELFAQFLERGFDIYKGTPERKQIKACITGASLGLPGVERVFDETNVERILRGDVFIDTIPLKLREMMTGKNIRRLVKGKDGEARFENVESTADVIKLAARGVGLDLNGDFGFPDDRMSALDLATQLAIGAGIDALRDAGIPLVMQYKTTTKGTKLIDRWMLPKNMREDTGIVFGSVFPGHDSFARIITAHEKDQARRDRLADLVGIRDGLIRSLGSDNGALHDLERRIDELRLQIEREQPEYPRQFLFQVLAMGHSQFAEYIGARGPNSHVDAACATGTQAIATAQDWIQNQRCRRVIVLTADDVTSDTLWEWFGSGFLISGVAATDENVEDAAIPFDRRRHGMIVGMGGAGIVMESEEAARERGITPICDVMNTVTGNSAYHGSRLDVPHICDVMETLIADAEKQWGINRHEIAPETVFVSHETYTPARGGSASAEIYALRHVFGESTDKIVIANTKGYTGHPMGVAIEDVVAIKALETGVVPPVPNYKEVDPDLGKLNLSKGGTYPVRYALRLGAGFGSQIAMSLTRHVPAPDGRRRAPGELGYEYRIADRNAWRGWLTRATGVATPELEVVKRTLRVKDDGLRTRRVEKPAAATTAPPPAPVQPAPQPTPVEVTPEPVAAPVGTAPTAVSEVQEKVLQIVAEQTGYPRDMLDLDLDLEADLGIDTVKQAEMFAAIREAYDIPRDDTIKLRDYPTLGHAMQFVHDKRPDLKAGAPATASAGQPAAAQPAPPQPTVAEPPVAQPVAEKAAEAPSATASDDEVTATVLGIIAEQTGYPIDMLDLDLDLEADLGIDTVKQAEMFAAIREAYDIARDDTIKLRDYPTLAHAIQFVLDKRPDLKAGVPAAASADQPATTDSGVAPPAMTKPQEPVTKAPQQDSAKSPATSDDDVEATVLGIIAEQTGYPIDMLDLDLDLEADLGIDTVKQAEMFAAIREAYNIARDDTIKLREYPTLAHAIQFVHDRRPDAAVQAGTGESTKEETAAATVEETSAMPIGDMDAANAVPRRVPVAHLRPDLDLCKPTGVELGSGSRVLVMTDAGGVGNTLVGRLEKRGVSALVIDDTPTAEKLTERIVQWRAEGPIHGVYWLPALDDEGPVSEMDLSAWREATRVRVKLLYTTMRTLYEDIGGPGTFLVSATRLGGRHGYDDTGASAPLGGAVTGFTKAFKREKPEVLVKAVDFELSRKKAAFADLLIEETLRDPGLVETGYKDGHRWSIGLEDVGVSETSSGIVLDGDTVFVVTGAAGSIVSAITADLAAASGGTFHLLDLAPKPDPQDADLQRFADDRESLKRDIFARLKESGERVTPIMVEKELGGIERKYAALSALQAIEKAGGTAHYYSVNLLDGDAVGGVMKQVKEKSGRIDVLVHAAGLEISRTLPDKEPAEFDLVFDVKSDGWFNVMSGVGDMTLGAAVVFSSIAGRFGNAGQTDYSAANDLLCKAVSNLRVVRPKTHGVAVDWTAWGGIGMASRGSIPTIMKQAGIDMLPPEAGIPIVRRELTTGDVGGEVVIAGSLGAMLEEFDDTGGLDTSENGVFGTMLKSKGVMTERLVGMGLYGGLTVETTLNPQKQPFLYDHQIDGTPVLPGVMGIEALVEVARLVFPGRYVGSVENVDFIAPFKFYRGEPRTVIVRATFRKEGDDVIANCRLVGTRKLHGREEPETTTHFTAGVRLVTVAPQTAKTKQVAEPLTENLIGAGDIYKVYFHGPSYQVVERSWRAGDEVIGAFKKDLPSNHQPADLETLTSPRLIELCFQTAGLSEMVGTSAMGLPHHIDQVDFLRPADKPSEYFAAVTTGKTGSFDARVVDDKGNVYLTVRGYRTMQLPNPIEQEVLERLKTNMGAAATK